MSEPKRLEIHSHTTVSDGSHSPAELAELMAEHGVDLWALTDHDTVGGCRAGYRAATDAGVEFLPGIEISASRDGTSIHVLGYGFDPETPQLQDYGEEMEQARRDRMEKMVDRMCELGFPVDFDDVVAASGGGNLCRPHLARALKNRGHVDTMQEAFDRWIDRDGPGYVPMARPSVAEAIEMIGDAGGIVVLAHPARYGDITGALEGWKEAGLWGLEVRHPSHGVEDEERLSRWADEFDLGKTASNDWHGNDPDDVRRLGEVVFPNRWRRAFLEVVDEESVVGRGGW